MLPPLLARSTGTRPDASCRTRAVSPALGVVRPVSTQDQERSRGTVWPRLEVGTPRICYRPNAGATQWTLRALPALMHSMGRTTRRLTREQVIDGFRLCLQNVGDLQQGALATVSVARAVALALAQVAQEELGKSMLLLCAATFQDKADWREFWRRWNNHDAKASMAAWYEWIDPLRMSVRDEHGRQFDGIPVRGRYSYEKEAGLYVDFDDEFGAFVLPAWRVPAVEAFGRIGAMGSLALTAAGIHDVIMHQESDFRFDFLSRHVRRLWRGFVSQEEMMTTLSATRSESDRHERLVLELEATFQENRAGLRNSLSRRVTNRRS